MKFVRKLPFYLLAFILTGSLFSAGCSDNDVTVPSEGSGFALLNNLPKTTDAEASISLDEKDFYIFVAFSVAGQPDFKTYIGFSNLALKEEHYDLNQEEIRNQLAITAGVILGGDVLYYSYLLDTTVATNYLAIETFDRENCLVKGSYDLTFICEDRGGFSCNNPVMGARFRLANGRFEAPLERC